MSGRSAKVTQSWWLGLMFIDILTGCQRPTAKDAVRQALVDTVGINVGDCGRSAIDDSRFAQRDCVFDSHRDRKPFIVLFEVAGKEGELYEEGLAGDSSGGVYTLEIASGDNFRKGGHLAPRACPTPPKLEVVGNGVVSCSWK